MTQVRMNALRQYEAAMKRLLNALPDHTEDAILIDVPHAHWCIRIACDGECTEYGGEA